MLLTLAVSVVTVLLAWLLVRWWQVKGYWAARGVPYEPPHPFFGSLTFLQKKNPGIWMREMYDRFKAPYVGIWLFWRPALIINSPEIGRRVLVKDFDVFRNRLLGSGIDKSDPIGGQNIFTLKEPVWSSVRPRLTPVFTSLKLKGMHNLFKTKSKELTQRIENDLKAKKPMELRSLYADYSTDVIGIASFGVHSDTTLTGESHMRSVTKDFMKFNFVRGVAWTSIFFMPEVARFFRFSLFPKSAVAYFRKVYKQIVAQRGGYSDDAKENDLLDALRRMKYNADKTDQGMDEDLVIAQAAVFLQGGFDTSAAALTFLTYELAFLPEVQERLYNELVKAKEALGDKELDGSALSELVTLNSVIKETLRKYPPLGWLDRICDRDYAIDDNLTIAKGTTVYVNAVGMHYDPAFYPDPDRFDPDRFLPENDDGSRPYMPFGEGPRNCIGMRFAYRTMWYALAAIVLKFKILPPAGAVRPLCCEIDKVGLLLMPGVPYYVQYVPRT